MSGTYTRIATATAVGAGLIMLAGCEVGPKTSTQLGYRGTGLDQVVNVNTVKKAAAIPPEAYPLPPDGGPAASTEYKNLQVLGGVSKDRFDHLMANITQWVAPPEQGCNYCHNPENMASDEKYTKIVARRMLQMTQNINSTWSTHVKQTGVTCYTCHAGNAIPVNKWALAVGPANPHSIRGNKRGQNTPDATVGYASLPTDSFADYLDNRGQIRVAGDTALPNPNHVVSIKDAEKTYGLMMHLSSGLGVNCTYCHNTQSFRAWNISRAQRVTAYYGIRMVRDINASYLTPLQSVFPDYRKGPRGDVYKVNCTTCHQGLSKPLGGASMIAQAPALMAPAPAMLVTPERPPLPVAGAPAAPVVPQASDTKAEAPAATQ